MNDQGDGEGSGGVGATGVGGGSEEKELNVNGDGVEHVNASGGSAFIRHISQVDGNLT